MMEKKRVLKILDFDTYYKESIDTILLNKLNYSSSDYAKELHSHIFSNSDDMDMVATCMCGRYRGDFYEGMKCTDCNTYVSNNFDIDIALKHKSWLTMPEGIPGVLNPTAYFVLATWLSSKTDNYIDNILNTKIPLHPSLEGVVLGRGFKYFYDNFDFIMNFFMTQHGPTIQSVSKSSKIPYIKYFIATNRQKIFCTKLPVLSNLLHPVTTDKEEHSYKYVDKSCEDLFNAIGDLAHLEFSPLKNRSLSTTDRIMYNAYKSYITYIKDIDDTRLNGKRALIRGHLFGARYHFSFRSVITPITGEHDFDDLLIPWKICVNSLKIHILGRLLATGKMNLGDAIAKHRKALFSYDADIHAIMQRFIDESPYKGLPVLYNRNPSLKRGSIQLLFGQIKLDIDDETCSLSPLAIKDMNADFDGKALPS